MVSRPPSAVLQGDLDGLCGVYSIVNAVQWALHASNLHTGAGRGRIRPLTMTERQTLFGRLVMTLGAQRPAATFVTNGVSSRELARLLRTTRDWVSEHRGATLLAKRPFYRQRNVARSQLVAHLRKHLSAPGAAAIVDVEAPPAHWTVLMGASEKRFLLLDSGGRLFLRLASLRDRAAGTPNGLTPGSIFLLRLSPEADGEARRP